MLLLTTIAVSLLLAVSAKVETKAAVRTVAEDLANAKATTIVDSNHRLQAKMTKAHDQMIAKFSAMYESKKHFKAVGAVEAMTTVPYTSTGFIYQNAYWGDNVNSDTTCSSISEVVGYRVNLCVVTNDYAFKVQLTQDSCSGGIVQYFGDKDCTIMLGTSDLAPYMNMCEVDASNQDFDYPVYQSWGCGSSGSPISPAGSINALVYDVNKCSGSIYGYFSFPVNTCLPSTESSLMFKYYCDGVDPYQGYWLDPTCSGPATGSNILPNTCSADASDDDDGYYTTDDDDDYDDDYEPAFINPPPTVSETNFPTQAGPVPFAFQLFCPSMAPTMKPAYAPTMFPTAAAATAVSLTLAQKVYGIDAATFNMNLAYTTAFAATIASTMTGITPSNIINLQISGSSRRRLAGRSLAVDNEAVTATYTISATTTSSSNSLYYQLNSAVTSGAFNTALTQYAAMYGASGLEGCTSNAVGSPSSSSNGLSAGAIAGIVIGCVAGVAIIAGVAFFLIFSNKKPPMAQAQPASEMSNKA